MEVKLIKDYIAIREVENPFQKRKTESGLYLPSGLSQTNETGEAEVMDKIVGFGVVEIAGPDCKSVKAGDGVFYDRRNPRPLPFKKSLWHLNEGNVIGYVSDEDGSVQKAIDDYNNETVIEDKQIAQSKIKIVN